MTVEGRYKPDRRTFEELARTNVIVPVWREVLADSQTPVAAFLRLDPHPNGFLLESVEGGERWARYSFIGGDSFAVVKAREGRVEIEGAPPLRPEPGEPPLSYVKRLVTLCRAPDIPGLPPFHGGAVGYIGYDCVRELERLPRPPDDDLGLPDLALVLTRSFVVFDHFTQRAFVITNVATNQESGDVYGEAVHRCEEVIERLTGPLAAPALELDLETPASFHAAVGDDEYAAWVERAKEHIYAGDIFQVVPSRRFDAPLEGSAFDAYRVLRTINPSPYMYYLRFGPGDAHDAIEVAGSSPEPLVRVTGDAVVTRPIAGTRGRGGTDEEDAALAEDLLSDVKERAEHVM
ncbi:MAG: anthranilate synthase component I family protein, partial [Actinomycetota bacterium]